MWLTSELCKAPLVSLPEINNKKLYFMLDPVTGALYSFLTDNVQTLKKEYSASVTGSNYVYYVTLLTKLIHMLFIYV